MVGEVQGSGADTYLRGANLISANGDTYYLFNGHGDVVNLSNTSGTSTKTYEYDAFGVEQNIDELDDNPFRYCGEYFDQETGTYYLRARYYDPSTGRFTQEDTHWGSANSIYGDTPMAAFQSKDALGLTYTSYAPQIFAIQQSGNLYVYCIGNPVDFADQNGKALHWLAKRLITGFIEGISSGVVAAFEYAFSAVAAGEEINADVLIGVFSQAFCDGFVNGFIGDWVISLARLILQCIQDYNETGDYKGEISDAIAGILAIAWGEITSRAFNINLKADVFGSANVVGKVISDSMFNISAEAVTETGEAVVREATEPQTEEETDEQIDDTPLPDTGNSEGAPEISDPGQPEPEPDNEVQSGGGPGTSSPGGNGGGK